MTLNLNCFSSTHYYTDTANPIYILQFLIFSKMRTFNVLIVRV